MLVILLALGGYVYFVEVPHEKKAAEEKKLLTLDKEAVSELTLTYPNRTLTLKKTDAGKWRITQPIEADADETTVKNLINAIADAEVKRTLDEAPQDLAVYGLTTPVVKAKLVLKDGKSFPLDLVRQRHPSWFFHLRPERRRRESHTCAANAAHGYDQRGQRPTGSDHPDV